MIKTRSNIEMVITLDNIPFFCYTVLLDWNIEMIQKSSF